MSAETRAQARRDRLAEKLGQTIEALGLNQGKPFNTTVFDELPPALSVAVRASLNRTRDGEPASTFVLFTEAIGGSNRVLEIRDISFEYFAAIERFAADAEAVGDEPAA